MKEFDIYIISSKSDWNTAKKTIPLIKKNIYCRNIFIVSSAEIKSEVESSGCCGFVNEDEVFEGLSYGSVKKYLKDNGFMEENAGWYLQQFLKLSISTICQDEYYLVWDADTIPMRKIDFFDKDGKPYFNLKREYFYSYFRTITNLFGINKVTKESYISEHMLFNKRILEEMLQKITDDRIFAGSNFWEKILSASQMILPDFIKKDQRYFSEFETYGTYIDNFYPEFYSKRKLVTLRYGVDFFGAEPSSEILEWISKDFDTVSFEKWGVPQTEFIDRTLDKKYRQKYSAAKYVRNVVSEKKRKAYFAVIKRDFSKVNDYLKFIGTTKFDFFFENKVSYDYKETLFDSVLKRIKSFITSRLGYRG